MVKNFIYVLNNRVNDANDENADGISLTGIKCFINCSCIEKLK